MNTSIKNLMAGATALLMTGSVFLTGTGAALAQSTTHEKSRQNDKNNMRNLGIAAGVLAAQQAIKGKGTNALILGAGAAYAGKKYEDARKAQSKESASYRKYQYRNGVRVGYATYTKSGKKIASYGRVYDSANNRWTNQYRLVHSY